MKINKGDAIYICILLFLFQPIIEKYFSSGFKYYDELFVLFCFFVYLIKNRLTKWDYRTLLLLFVLTGIGLAGNVLSNSSQIPLAIFQDFLSNAKLVFFAIAAKGFRLSDKTKEKTE